MRKILVVLIAISFLAIGFSGVSAQDMGEDTPMVSVSDQLSLDGTVTVDSAYSEGPGFVVIHIDNNGSFGPVAGWAAIPPGHSHNITVEIDTAMATPTLYAMLHVDTGEVGVYEFGQVEGADGPVTADGAPIAPPFNATIVDADDQFVSENSVNINSVVTSEAGWLVIHAGDAESFGAVLGFAAVEAGNNTDVNVSLEGDVTNVVWPMLHSDTGEMGTYEFGEVEGADGPVALDGTVATFPIWTVPHMRVSDQVVVHGENYPGGDMMDDMAPTLVADSVLSDGAGWLVVHAASDGGPGPVLGWAALEDGLNENVEVALEGEITNDLWPMMHTDTGEMGTYEFGQVEGADGPVTVDGNVVTFGINAAPALLLQDEATLADGTLTVDGALIDHVGWLVIHQSSDGGPGPVIGQTRLLPGLNSDVSVEIDAEAAGDQVFPMLHYDTGEVGVYEFGEVEGADAPVFLDGSPVVAPLAIGSGE